MNFVTSLLLNSTYVMVNVSNWAAESSQTGLMLTQNCANSCEGGTRVTSARSMTEIKIGSSRCAIHVVAVDRLPRSWSPYD